MSEVLLDRITEFETAQRQLEAGQLMASRERIGLTNRIRRLGMENLKEEFRQIHKDRDDARRRLRRLESFDMTITRSRMIPEVIEELIAQRVAEALANYEATCAANALEAESPSQNGSDDNNGNGGNRNGNHEDRGNNENGNPNENGRGAMPVAHVCTYQDFMKYQPLNFKGIKGVVGMTRWFEKMETCSTSAIVQKCIKLKRSYKQPNHSSSQSGSTIQFPFSNVRGSNVAKAYTAGGNEGRVYGGPHPLCNKCKLHHVGPCTIKCRSCGKIDHLTRDCKPAVPAAVNHRAPVPVILKARGKAYAIGGGDANLGSNIITELGSFEVIIGMDWLANNYAVIVYDEKIVHIPFGDEILIVQGDRSDKKKKSTLNILLCTKTQKYMEKGFKVFLAQVTKKEDEAKSQEKRLEDVPIV
ncbi:putative reverse transcriptase domain-containing protein [Tanacetum coccineum]